MFGILDYILILILGFVAFLLLSAIRILVPSTFRYISQKSTYSQVWRHPRFAPGLFEMFDLKGGFQELFELMKKPDGSYHKVADLGPHLDGSHYILISDPSTVKQIFSSKSEFPKLDLSYDTLKEMLGNGLINSSGEFWFAQRKLITPFFHFNALKEFLPGMVQLTERFVDSLSQTEGFVPAKSKFSEHTSSVINYLAFGNRFNSAFVNEGVGEMIEILNYWILGYALFGTAWNLVPFRYGMGFKKYRRIISSKLSSAVDQSRKEPEDKHDLLSYLSHAKRDGHYLDNTTIVDECFTMMFAGQDTTATTLAWVMYFLSIHKDAQVKLQNEVDTVLQGRAPDSDDLIAQLKYCKNFLKETLRLKPVVPVIDRRSEIELEIDGIKLPKNTVIGVNILSLHRDPEIYENPDSFIPERWEMDNKTFVFVPFSAGQRNCIGSKFATQEILVTIAMIAQKFDVSMNPSSPVQDVILGVLSPSGLELSFTKRKI